MGKRKGRKERRQGGEGEADREVTEILRNFSLQAKIDKDATLNLT